MVNRWTDSELDLLKGSYSERTNHELATFFLRRTESSIQTKATQLGWRKELKTRYRAISEGRKGVKGAWTEEENSKIRTLYSKAEMAMLRKELPNRNECAILHKGEKLGLKRPTNGRFTVGFSRTTESRRKQAKTVSGDNNVSKRADVKIKISNALSGKPKSQEHKNKLSQALKGRYVSPQSGFQRGHKTSSEVLALNSERLKKLNKDPSFQRKRMKALMRKPTKPERTLMTLIERNNLPFRYVGDGEVIIGTLNPDFIHNNGDNKIIEVFGRVFHDPAKRVSEIRWKSQYFGRLAYYSQHGWDCLVLWDDDLDDEQAVVHRIREFLSTPNEK